MGEEVGSAGRILQVSSEDQVGSPMPTPTELADGEEKPVMGSLEGSSPTVLLEPAPESGRDGVAIARRVQNVVDGLRPLQQPSWHPSGKPSLGLGWC